MLLPPPPLRLKSSFVWKNRLGGIVLFLAGIATIVGFGWWLRSSIVDLLDQSQVWKNGVLALSADVNGKETTHKFILHEYELNVTYLDANQTTHQGQVKFDTLFSSVNQESEPSVRYLESDPERFALSWAMDVTISRWAAIVFMALVFVLAGGLLIFSGVLVLRRLADAHRCAARCDEVVVGVTKVVPQLVKGKHTANEYHFAGKLIDGREVSGKVSFEMKYEPLFADGGKKTMLALIAQENVKRPVILRGDFYPLELTADEQAKVRQAIASRSAG